MGSYHKMAKVVVPSYSIDQLKCSLSPDKIPRDLVVLNGRFFSETNLLNAMQGLDNMRDPHTGNPITVSDIMPVILKIGNFETDAYKTRDCFMEENGRLKAKRITELEEQIHKLNVAMSKQGDKQMELRRDNLQNYVHEIDLATEKIRELATANADLRSKVDRLTREKIIQDEEHADGLIGLEVENEALLNKNKALSSDIKALSGKIGSVTINAEKLGIVYDNMLKKHVDDKEISYVLGELSMQHAILQSLL